jgi:hypothetical protein
MYLGYADLRIGVFHCKIITARIIRAFCFAFDICFAQNSSLHYINAISECLCASS